MKTLSLLLLLILACPVYSQVPSPKRFAPSASDPELWKMRRYEIAGGLGITQFFGDIGGFSIGKNTLGLKDFSFLHTRYNFNAAFKYKITNRITGRLNLSAGTFHATDKRGSNEMRAIETTTIFFEPSLLGEYYIVRSKGESSYIFQKGKRVVLLPLLSTLNVYAIAGIGGLSYNASVDHGPIVTGTIKPGGFTAIIPAGIGVSMAYSGKTSFGIELLGHYAFSDYIDGYTSQFSKANDVYYSFVFNICYKLPTGIRGLPSFRFR